MTNKNVIRRQGDRERERERGWSEGPNPITIITTITTITIFYDIQDTRKTITTEKKKDKKRLIIMVFLFRQRAYK